MLLHLLPIWAFSEGLYSYGLLMDKDLDGNAGRDTPKGQVAYCGYDVEWEPYLGPDRYWAWKDIHEASGQHGDPGGITYEIHPREHPRVQNQKSDSSDSQPSIRVSGGCGAPGELPHSDRERYSLLTSILAQHPAIRGDVLAGLQVYPKWAKQPLGEGEVAH